MQSTMKSRNSDDLVNNQDETECDEEFSQVVIDYQKQVENLIADLFCMEGQLSTPDESLELELHNATFDQVLAKYGKHEEFIGRFCEFSQVVMKCQDKGHEIRDNENLNLEEHERDQVNIQIDALLVCYEKLKILASDRLRRLQRILEDRQKLNVDRFEQWLSNIESKVCNATNIGPDYESILRQADDMKKLSHELGNKQEFLNFMSNVIIFDEIDTESLQMQSKSYDNLDTRLENMNTRWEKVCTYVQDRNDKLKRAESIWRIVNSECPPIMRWIKKTKRLLDEISEALKNLTGNSQSDKAFVQKLIPRYDKIKSDIKGKQSSYSDLESRVRADIEKFDDPCSMLVIEIEKKLEELQRSWDELKNQKRKIHFTLENLSIANLNDSNCNPISANKEPVFLKDEEIKCKTSLSKYSNEHLRLNKDNVNNSIQDLSDSSENEEKQSNITVPNSLSEPREFDSSNSPDSKSNFLSSNNTREQSFSLNNSQDELSSNAFTTPVRLSGLLMEGMPESDHQDEIHPNHSNYTIDVQDQDNHIHEEHHNCRVEEWKHSLESFSNWIKEVESILGIAETLDNCGTNDPLESNWSNLELDRQFITLNEIESSINSKYKEELDHLIDQGQQIIKDLIPEIGDNNYEIDLKKILNDIETRYDLVIKCLVEKKHQISDKNRWSELLNTMKASCLFVIGKTGQLLPEADIGHDLITLAQQQDQLCLVKEEVMNNSTVETCRKEAKLFLKFCDILDGNSQTSPLMRQNDKKQADVELKNDFMKLRDDISNQLDILSLHLSEFFQLIDERLDHLAEVYKDMHSLKQKIQEFAPKLQVAEILKSNWQPIEALSVEQLSEQLEDLKLFRERLTEGESSHKLMNLILNRMNHLGVPLSQQNLNQINELNSTWAVILEEVDERQKLIEEAFDNQGSPEQKYLEKTLDDMPDWMRKVAVSKVPYFLNRKTNESSWDHPKFKNILNELSCLKQVVFSAYRIALQLRTIQQKLGLDLLMLEDLDEVLLEANLRKVTKQPPLPRRCYYKTLYGVEQILLILRAIFEKVKEEKSSLDLALSMELTLNWLLNLYDPTRTGYISALSLKVALTVLCCATLEEKHSSIFKYVLDDVDWCHNDNDSNTIVDILRVFSRIPIYLGEGDAFPDHESVLEESMFQCFAKTNQRYVIDLKDYMNWIKDEPQIVIWMVVLHRLLVSENAVHKVKCNLCKVKPMKGLRYKCLKCLSYNICQNCFLTMRDTQEHHKDHEMREYCSKINSDERVRNIARVLGNKIKSKPS